MSLAIDLKAIDPSPTNPRKTFGADGLEELADSIRSKGLLQPILVRPSPKGGGRYELVAGERRFRAAKLARLHEIEAIVRELSDEEAVEVQVIENAQREDVHPLEECDGFRMLIETHGRAVDDVAAKVGKSRGYVYARMKLAALGKEGRKAYLDGKLTASTALYVARIPAKLQARAVKEITTPQYGAEVMSARTASAHIQRTFMLRLKDAPFPKNDATLMPEAGTCGDCPKRTGNQRELFGDVEGADVCTDPICYRAKVDADFERKADAARATGREVIDDPKTLKKLFPYPKYNNNLAHDAGYVPLDTERWVGQKRKTVRTLVGKDVLPVIIKAPDGTAIEAVPKSAVDKASRATSRSSSGSSAKTRDFAKQDREYARKRELEQRVAKAIGAVVAEKWEANDALTLGFWRELASEAFEYDDFGILERRGLEAANRTKVEKQIAKLTVAQLRGLVAELAFHRAASAYGNSMADAAKAFGVNAEPIAKREKEAAAAAAKAEKELEKAKAKKKGGKADGAKKDGSAKKPSKTASKKKAAKKSRAQRTVREGICRVCKCTDLDPCPGGCGWVEPDLCSECVDEVT